MITHLKTHRAESVHLCRKIIKLDEGNTLMIIVDAWEKCIQRDHHHRSPLSLSNILCCFYCKIITTFNIFFVVFLTLSLRCSEKSELDACTHTCWLPDDFYEACDKFHQSLISHYREKICIYFAANLQFLRWTFVFAAFPLMSDYYLVSFVVFFISSLFCSNIDYAKRFF